MTPSHAPLAGRGRFASTHRTFITRLKHKDAGSPAGPLDDFCTQHHYPLYCSIRRRGLSPGRAGCPPRLPPQLLRLAAFADAESALIPPRTPYDDDWQSGDNGGHGWGAWDFFSNPTPVLLGNSATNGAGDTTPPAGDINTPSGAGGRAWGLFQLPGD